MLTAKKGRPWAKYKDGIHRNGDRTGDDGLDILDNSHKEMALANGVGLSERLVVDVSSTRKKRTACNLTCLIFTGQLVLLN